MGTGEADSVDVISRRVAELIFRFGEAQGYATHRVVEYHHWILAKEGQVVRCFAWLGERGELLCNTGAIADAERRLPFANRPTDQWMPDEEDVMTVASGWSFDPTKLSSESGPAVNGIFVRMK